MRLRAVAIGTACIAWLISVNVTSSGQAPAAPPSAPIKKPVQPAVTAPRPVTPAAQVGKPRPAYHPPTDAAFKAATQSLFQYTCGECHNSAELAGGLDVALYSSPDSLTVDPARWELILAKLKSGEMPPLDVERPDAEIKTLISFLETEFARADAAMKPDPGRVTARRLNRAEYTNTIRDLLAIEFRADKNFPTDDSGEGFDNIGEILTVSPILMEKYMSAAARIADRAIAAVKLPKPIEVEYSLRYKSLRRLDPSNVEATHRFDFDADYELKIGLPGQRAKDAPPVTLGLWVDGKLAHTMPVETKP